MDKSIVELVNLIEASLGFVEDIRHTQEKLKNLEDTITDLLNEIGKCSNFVRKYIESRHSFLGNAKDAWKKNG